MISDFSKKITFEVVNDVVTGLSGDNFLFDLWETWLKIVFHESLSFFLILLTFCHDHFQNVLLMIYQSVLPELCSDGFAGLNVRTHNIIAVRNVLKKV
jgi:hypothetical protein